MGVIEGAIPRDAIRQGVATGGAAGNITVSGIGANDRLVSVMVAEGAGTDVTDLTDLTAEFDITAANTINNTGGTSTAGAALIVTWLAVA